MAIRPLVLAALLSVTHFAIAQQSVNTLPAGNITGHGTAHYIAGFAAPTVIRNSSIFESSSARVGIGTTTPQATLDVNGAVNSTEGFNLGGTPFALGSTTNANVFLGFAGNSSALTGTYNNTAVGYRALLANSTGQQNTAIGYQSLLSNTDGIQNTALGQETLLSNSTGSRNVAIGNATLYSNTTGSDNVSINGLSFNTTGSANVVIGFGMYGNTTGSDNTAVGRYTIGSTSGNYNTAEGELALYSNPCDASYNTAVGYAAGYTSQSLAQCGLGFHDTFVGANTQMTDLRLNNATAIGANAQVSASNAMVLGSINGVNGGTANTNVGIGTTAPSNIFTIGRGFGDALADGWSTYSSRRWKADIENLPDALSKVTRLRGVSYNVKSSGRHEIGLIAEEVGKVVPEVVTYEENGKDARGVDYGRLTALLIEATKEQQTLIEKQELRIEAQEAQIRGLALQLKAVRDEVMARRRSSSHFIAAKARNSLSKQ